LYDGTILALIRLKNPKPFFAVSDSDTEKVTPDQAEKTEPAQLECIAARASRWLHSPSDAKIAQRRGEMRNFAPP
jgi:hypothetical protein